MSFLRLHKRAAADTSSSNHGENVFLNRSVDVLTSGFPNPDRVGCPDRTVLEGIASHKLGLKEISPWLKHLSSCSDCFQDVSDFRRTAHVREAATWAFAAAAATVIVAIILFLVWNNVAPQQAKLDLRNASISRGVENPPSEKLPRLSRSSKRVIVYLPAGTPGDYELRIIGESGTVLAHIDAVGKTEDSATVLRTKIDLSRTIPGLYSLVVKHDSTSTIYRIQIE